MNTNDQVMTMTNWYDVVTAGANPEYAPVPSPQEILTSMWGSDAAAQMVEAARQPAQLIPGLSNTALAVGAIGILAVLILAANR
jgi:hypothetical protein